MLRVFTAFSGYDSQCLALNRIGIEYELVGWSEIDKHAGSGFFEIIETESIICGIKRSIMTQLRMQECNSKRIPYITDITIKSITPL